MSNTLGDKIRTLRKDVKKLTLEELAKLTDSSKGYIWELENRDTRKPSAEKLMKIANVLGVTAEFLLNDKKSKHDDDDVLKEALFRDFDKLKDKDKERFLKMVKDWGGEE